MFKLASAADQILTILALIRSGGRYPLRFRRHIRVFFPLCGSAPVGGLVRGFLLIYFSKYPTADAVSEEEEEEEGVRLLPLLLLSSCSGFSQRERVIERHTESVCVYVCV